MIVRNAKLLGAQIRRHRRLSGLSQTSLGELTGLRQATISSLENGSGGTLDTVFVVLSALKLDLSLLDRSVANDNLGDIF